MIGIIGAMAIEVEEILAKLEHPQTETISGMDFVRGAIQGVECVVARCNVGKVNAAICAQTMILRYAPSRIINSGVAGGIGADVKDRGPGPSGRCHSARCGYHPDRRPDWHGIRNQLGCHPHLL